MGGRWTALGLALALSLSLTACAGGADQGTQAGRLSNRGTSGTETPAARRGSLADDGRYYAGADGQVARRRSAGESEWEKLGRELRESWDKMTDGTEQAAKDAGRAAGDAARGAEQAAGRAARDAERTG